MEVTKHSSSNMTTGLIALYSMSLWVLSHLGHSSLQSLEKVRAWVIIISGLGPLGRELCIVDGGQF